jgi:hypothetical protein
MEFSEEQIIEVASKLNCKFWTNIYNHRLHEKLIAKNGSRVNAISATFHIFLVLTRKEVENMQNGLTI